MEENNLFQQAKDAIMNLTNMRDDATAEDEQAAKSTIQAAYENASPEEQQHLEQLEQQIDQTK